MVQAQGCVCSGPADKIVHLLGVGVSNDIVDGVLGTLDFLGFNVGDIDGEFVLNIENKLDLFERVQTKILLEVRVGRNGVGVDLVKALDNLYNTRSNLLLRKAVVLTVEAQERRLNLSILSNDHAGSSGLGGGGASVNEVNAL